jgi:hypothetical protein
VRLHRRDHAAAGLHAAIVGSIHLCAGTAPS